VSLVDKRRLHGKNGMISMDGPVGPITIAVKTEWSLTLDDSENESEDESVATQLLAALLKRAGGEIMIFDSELNEDDTIVVEADEKSGGFKVTLLPDYVKTGRDAPTVDLTHHFDDLPVGSPLSSGGSLISESMIEDAIKQVKKRSPYGTVTDVAPNFLKRMSKKS
jgi:hypothetical protein